MDEENPVNSLHLETLHEELLALPEVGQSSRHTTSPLPQQKQSSIPEKASSLEAFIENPDLWQPQQCWIQEILRLHLQVPEEDKDAGNESQEEEKTIAQSPSQARNFSSFIIVQCLRKHATEAVHRILDAVLVALLNNSICLEETTSGPCTPTITSKISTAVSPATSFWNFLLCTAAQYGNMPVVDRLLREGFVSSPNVVVSDRTSGTKTALLQACHFGHAPVAHLLLHTYHADADFPNSNRTTPLMRACQEGHLAVVRLLLFSFRNSIDINRTNRKQMTALMLAAQRGHLSICRLLLQAGARLNGDGSATATTGSSTVLMLACKRSQVQVARFFVSKGCELYERDHRQRTARDIASLMQNRDLLCLLDPVVQVCLMQQEKRLEMSCEIMKHHLLVQARRAVVARDSAWTNAVHDYRERCTDRNTKEFLERAEAQHDSLIKLVTLLPTPLVQKVTSYLPLPSLWTERLTILSSRSQLNPNSTILSALDLIDEILEDNGFLDACDVLNVPLRYDMTCCGGVPLPHAWTWREWRRCIGKSASPFEQKTDPLFHESESSSVNTRITLADVPTASVEKKSTIVEFRRKMNYIGLLAGNHHLGTRLCETYRLPWELLYRLIRLSDVALLLRRTGSSQLVRMDVLAAQDICHLGAEMNRWQYFLRRPLSHEPPNRSLVHFGYGGPIPGVI